MAGVEHDAISGQNTTGHEWDGIRELNTPLPKWWIYVFFICVIWGIGYMIAYPAVPTPNGYTKGVLGYSSRVDVAESIASAKADMGEQLEKLNALSVEEIAADNDLRTFASRGGEAMFKENCVPCHQSGGAGALGYPSLADDAWIWGGSLEAIQTTILHGVRSDVDEDTRFAQMPAFGADELLEPNEIEAVADYLLALSQGNSASGEGQQIYVDNCAVCHSSDMESPKADGNVDAGAPALNDQAWLFGGEKSDIVAQINNPKHGVMPAWSGRLDEATIKQLTVYVHSLGGGE